MAATDQDLLRRFAANGDETAFAALVERHAPLVLSACRRVLGDQHDAEDASQAVFLMLAKHAGTIAAESTLAPWIHRVAINMARDVRKARLIRDHHHREAAAMPRSSAPDSSADLGDEIDEALCQLPERERSAIVLFHLEGRPLEEVARLVNRPVGTVGVWLHRGRERLGGLLRRRGVAVPAAALLAGLGTLSAAEIPAGFVAATTKAAVAFTTTGALATPAAAFAAKGCQAMKLVAVAKSSLLAATLTAVMGAAGVLAVAAESGGKHAGNPNAPLGAPDFRPLPERTVGWRGDGSGRYPGAKPPTVWERTRSGSGYATKGILWMTPMPTAVSSPIVVGERIFITGEFSDLYCLEKQSGRIAWIRSNLPCEGVNEEERKANPTYAEKLAPLLPQLAKANADLADELNGQQANALTAAPRQPAALAKKRDLEKQIMKEWLAINNKKDEYGMYGAQGVFGYAGPTPVSDGKRVCAFFATGISVCYDLDGTRKWIVSDRGGAAEHGNFTSPLLCDNQLLVWAYETRSYDVTTGKLLWKNPCTHRNTYHSLYKLQSGGEDVVCAPNANFTRLRDGKAIWNNNFYDDAVPTPIAEGNVIFACAGYDNLKGFKAYKIPTSTDGGSITPALMIKSEWAADEMVVDKGKHGFDQSYAASPLFVDGLLYRVTEGGGLIVNDAVSGEVVYRKVLPMKSHTEYWNWAGAGASPTFAGKYIYLMDNQGTTVVIEPGRQYKEVAKNLIEELKDGKDQSQNLATPVFDGGRMYHRTPNFLYCIGDK